MSRTKSFVAQNGFTIEIYFTQKLSGTFRIMYLSAGQQQPDKLKKTSSAHHWRNL